MSAAWPADWAERMAGQGCLMCDTLGCGDNDFGILLLTGHYAEVHQKRWTQVAGYCAVIWRHGHIAEPTDLSPTDAGGYWNEVLAVGRAVGTLLNPIKLNYLTLGNTLPHLHTHVVPRYQHDPAPAAPLAWNQIVSDRAADETDLQAQAIELRRLLTRDQ